MEVSCVREHADRHLLLPPECAHSTQHLSTLVHDLLHAWKRYPSSPSWVARAGRFRRISPVSMSFCARTCAPQCACVPPAALTSKITLAPSSRAAPRVRTCSTAFRVVAGLAHSPLSSPCARLALPPQRARRVHARCVRPPRARCAGQRPLAPKATARQRGRAPWPRGPLRWCTRGR